MAQNASHSAALFREAFAASYNSTGGILGTGELLIAQQASPNMSVLIAAGRAVIPGTSVSPPSGFAWSTQGQYFGLNDAPASVTIATSSPTNPRIDAVYIGVTDSFYSGSTNTVVLGVVTGTPAASPVAPSVPANSLLLGTVAVAANATSIVTANITNSVALVSVVNTASTAALAAASQTIGLKTVIPTSAVNATVGTNGNVTFTAQTSFSLNGVFSATYDNYLFEFTFSAASGSAGVFLRMRASGTDAATNYAVTSTEINGSGTGMNANVNGQTQGQVARVGITSGSGGNANMTLFQPFLASFTRWLSGTMDADSVFGNRGGVHSTATSYDGITFLTNAAPTVTGTLRIYGYSNE